MRFLFYICIALNVCPLAHSQQPFRLNFHHLSRENGLTNNNIFFIHPDSRGFIWLGTLYGLVRFDGINCKNYTPENSKINGTIIKNIVEDPAGNLWIGSTTGLNFYDRKKDEFSTIQLPNHEKNFASFPFKFDKNGMLWVSISQSKNAGLYIYNTKNNSFRFVTDQISSHVSSNQSLENQEYTTIFCGGKNDNGLKKLVIKNYKLISQNNYFDKKEKGVVFSNIKEYLHVENDSTVWISGGNGILGLVKFNPMNNTYKTFQYFGNEKLEMLNQITSYKNFLIIGSYKGIYFFEKATQKFVQQLRHLPTNPSSLQADWNEVLKIDKNGNLLISQLGFGLDFANLQKTLAENWMTSDNGFSDTQVARIVQFGEQTFMKFQNENNTYGLDKNGKIIKKINQQSPIFTDSENRLWLTDGRSFKLLDKKHDKIKDLYFKELDGNQGPIFTMTEVAKSKFLLAGATGIFEFDEKANTLMPITELNKLKPTNCSPILFDKNTNQLFVSADWWTNFYVIKKTGNEWGSTKKVNLPFTVVSIKNANEPGKIWLGTNNGLVKMDSKTFNYQQFTTKNKLPDNFVTDILEEPNGDYWLVTNLGISYYSKSKNEYRNFTAKEGAISHEYGWNGAYKLPDGRAVFSGTNGITLIDKAALDNYKTIPKLQFTKISANEKEIKTEPAIGEADEITLKPHQNSFSIDIVGIEYANPEKISIEYKLEGIDNQWIKTNNNTTARYANVPGGSYKFLAKAVDYNTNISSALNSITIQVKAPFYQTDWFRGLLLMCLVGLGYLLYFLRVKQIRLETKRLEEIKRIRAEAEINSLRSQMNPHFIFNCLNTIDSYILTNKTNEASEFLNKFSRLIRLILENSRQEFIPLENEIDALQLYLKLEKERYSNFDFNIKFDKKLENNEYYIPTMIAQPFVENAILHGLRYKTEGGLINIDIVLENECLLLNIKDNGIGREASKAKKSLILKNKNSVGIKITEERIEKLNEIFPNRVSLKITDINNGLETGTFVTIKLPLLTHKNLAI